MKELTAGNHLRARSALACLASAWLCWTSGNCIAQSPATNAPPLPPELQEIVTLSREHMSDEIISAYVRNSGKTYTLDADEIIYLNSQGVSQHIITMLIETPPPAAPPQAPPVPASMQTPPPAVAVAPQPGAPPAPEAAPPALAPEGPPPVDVNYDYFHTQLAPFGTWVQVAPYGWCWRPDAAIAANPNWRPYYDMGQWVYTDNGWFWESDYAWGDIPFHYGNWVSDPASGWLWVPGYVWAPSWVFWRESDVDVSIGWAPLPPGAVFVNGGWFFNGVSVGVNFDFGLSANVFVFVGCDHFHDRFFRMRGHEYAFHMAPERVHDVFHRSVLRNNFRRDDHGRLVNDGIGRERVERLTGRQETPEHFQERDPVGDINHAGAKRVAETPRETEPRGEKTAAPAHETSFEPGRDRPRSSASESLNKIYRPPMSGGRGMGGEPRGGEKGGSKKRGGD